MKTRTFRSIAFTALMLLFASMNLSSQSVAGKWYSSLDIQGIPFEFVINISEENGTVTGTFDVPEQGALNIPLSTVTLEGAEFEFEFIPSGFSFTGITDPAYTSIIGYFKQGTINEMMRFGREPVAKDEDHPQSIRENYKKEEVYIEMRDGVKLFTSIYTPVEISGPMPVLLFRTPYNAEPSEESYNYFVTAYYRYLKEGYILVFQDVRGRYMSEGEFVNVRPYIEKKGKGVIDEATDTYDTAEWLINNVSFNNGRIGVTGISYPGFYATMAILARHPAIKAVSPQAPVTNWFLGDDWHHNGAFFLIDGTSFYNSFGDPQDNPTRSNSPALFQFGMQDSYKFYLEMGTLKNIGRLFPESVTYWHELMKHPDYDDWWKATDPRPHLKNVQPAVMTVGGWFDAEDLWGTLNTYKSLEKQNSSTLPNFLVMGPWSHGQWAGGEARNMGDMYWNTDANPDFQNLEMKFFNRYLKEGGDYDHPEAFMFVTGENRWEEFEQWPPADATEQNLWFGGSGSLSFTLPGIDGGYYEYVSDPARPVPYREDVHLRRDPSYMTDDQRFASSRPDVAVYSSPPLEEDITLTGPLTADLFVSMTGTDADFIVKLIDVFPDQARPVEGQDIDVPLGGYQMLVRGEVFRGKYRNSFEKPEPFVPGKVTEVEFTMPDVAHTFKKGHRIMVQVQSSWFPLVDRNPQQFVNIYECNESDFVKSTIRIYNSREYPSSIRVNLLKRELSEE
ncbi:MAG: CocE/NonD family hydrolase [Bacteroidales bacterium]|nr:CocE/NonD family hydrolase [Bacteroidales bacterium]